MIKMTKWKDIKGILRGKNKGSNLMALGVFLITLGASYRTIATMNILSLNTVSDVFILLGLMAFFVGFLKYMF